MSLLTIVQAAAIRCHYPQPSVAFSSLDPNIQLFVACAQDTGDEMTERINWQALKIQNPVTFVGNSVQTLFPLPTGFQALSPSDTFISSAYPTLRMIGPVNEDDLLRLKALPIVLFPSVWREVQGSIEFFPALQGPGTLQFTGNISGTGVTAITNVNVASMQIGAAISDTQGKLQNGTTVTSITTVSPGLYTVNISLPTVGGAALADSFTTTGVGETVSYVYAGTSWINISPGVPRVPSQWGADSDTAAFSERTVMLGTEWRWRRRKGLDYSEEFEAYERSLALVSGQESTQRVIPTSNSLVDWDNAFPGTILDNTDQNY